ncbi:MAG: hypothetical protein HEQ22_12860 [Sphingopyxis sp.]
MDYAEERTRRPAWAVLLSGLRPALPAVIGAAALTFLFAALMPIAWVAGIGWNLYLDRLSDLFVPPVGNGGRLALALCMTVIAALIAGIVALLIAQPGSTGLSERGRRLRRRAPADEDDVEAVLPRRRADFHPDDPPRPPIRAGRDLPADGLVPSVAAVPDTLPADADELDLSFAARADDSEADELDELVLSDAMPNDAFDDAPADAEAPWLQPAELAHPVAPEPVDNSLGAMVARFEAGLARRRQGAAAPVTVLAPDAVQDLDEPGIDFALEAALGTLQRMTRRAVG